MPVLRMTWEIRPTPDRDHSLRRIRRRSGPVINYYLAVSFRLAACSLIRVRAWARMSIDCSVVKSRVPIMSCRT